MPPSPPWTRLRRTVQQLGWLNATLYLLHRALAGLSGGRWMVQRYLFVAQRLDDTPLCPQRGHDVQVRPLDSTAPPPDCPRPEAVLQARWRQGALGLGAWRAGELVGFLWYVFDTYQEDEVRARYRLASSHAIWDFDVWIRPQDRLGWAFRRLWESARTRLRQQAVNWTCSRISAYNPASLRAHARIGTVALGSAIFLCCGRWQWMLSGLPPYCHWSRSPDHVPTFVFDTSTLPFTPAEEP